MFFKNRSIQVRIVKTPTDNVVVTPETHISQKEYDQLREMIVDTTSALAITIGGLLALKSSITIVENIVIHTAKVKIK